MTFWEGLNPPYSTIVVDPPWKYEGFVGSVGRGGVFAGTTERAQPKVKPLPYGSLSVASIVALPISEIAAKHTWLWLWTTSRYMPDSFTIAAAWGFRYRQLLVWRKTGNPSPFGGTVAPTHAEFLFLGSKGSPRVRQRIASSVIDAPKQNVHSIKPDVFLDIVEQTSPGPYVELFARAPRLGWDHWGHGYESGAA